jgi:hypothetical protein
MLTGTTSDYALQAIASIQGWTRQRFKLDPASAVLVSEVTCRIPGCPPLETVIAFWTGDDRRHQFRLLKPLAEVRYVGLALCAHAPRVRVGGNRRLRLHPLSATVRNVQHYPVRLVERIDPLHVGVRRTAGAQRRPALADETRSLH